MFDRRSLLKSLAGLPLATILATPHLARAAAETTQLTSITTDGGRKVAAALAMPVQVPAPAVILIHEWWGLNDQIKAMARQLADQGYLALAVDLFGGRVATTPDDARTLTQELKPDEARDTLTAWSRWLANHPDGTRRTGVVGWCFGGAWSLNAAVANPLDACVIYYGRCDLPAEQLSKLKAPVLGHFATRDAFITKDVVQRFEANMRQAGKPLELHWYDADHAFANPTGNNYDKDDAQLAWTRTMAFLGKTLKG